MLRLSEEELDWLSEQIPDAERSPKGGRPPADKRQVIAGVFLVLDNGAKWKDLPSRCGPKSTVHRWFLKWVSAGVFESLMRAAGRCVEDTGGSGSTIVSSMALFPKPRVAAIASVDGRWILFRDAEHA